MKLFKLVVVVCAFSLVACKPSLTVATKQEVIPMEVPKRPQDFWTDFQTAWESADIEMSSPIAAQRLFGVLLGASEGKTYEQTLALCKIKEEQEIELARAHRALLNTVNDINSKARGEKPINMGVAIYSIWPITFHEGYAAEAAKFFEVDLVKLGNPGKGSVEHMQRWARLRAPAIESYKFNGLNKNDILIGYMVCDITAELDEEIMDLGNGFWAAYMKTPSTQMTFSCSIPGTSAKLEITVDGFISGAFFVFPALDRSETSTLLPLRIPWGAKFLLEPQNDWRAMSRDFSGNAKFTDIISQTQLRIKPRELRQGPKNLSTKFEEPLSYKVQLKGTDADLIYGVVKPN